MATPDSVIASSEDYGEVLAAYLHSRSEAALYRASVLSHIFIESGLGPEDIIAVHFDALERASAGLSPREQARAVGDAHQFLLEVMIAYGVRYREYLELRMSESLRDAEARAALERERTLEAERIGREKAEILAVIAHELRTPLTTARGNLELVLRSLSRGQIERLPPLLGSAREAMDRLSRLSADLVEASRGAPPTLEFAQQDLGRVLEQTCAWARSAALAKDVSLEYCGADGDLQVKGNGDALLSVFGNLLSNAIRYTPPGGRVEVRYGVDGSWAWVEVRDTGIGMPPEVQGRVFEKFYRAPEARRTEARGLGLGLALVQQMVEAHRGRVAVESAPGRGSTFRVLLPLDDRRRSATGKNQTEPSGGGCR